MLNLVVSYKYDMDKTFMDDNGPYNYSVTENGEIFYVDEFEQYSRQDRIKFFEKLKEIETQLGQDMVAFSSEFKDLKTNEPFGCRDPKIEVSVLTDQELIVLDAKRAFAGEKILEKISASAERAVENEIYMTIGNSVDKNFADCMKENGKRVSKSFAGCAMAYHTSRKHSKDLTRKAFGE